VFDAYGRHPQVPQFALITGLPDAYGRGRIIGDYRRVALYGVDFLIAERSATSASSTTATDGGVIAARECAEQIRSPEELSSSAERLRHSALADARGRCCTSLPGSDQAAERRGDVGGSRDDFPDVYFERDLREGRIDETQAQEIFDDFVIKLRIVRFCVHPNTTRCSPATRCGPRPARAAGDDGRTLVTSPTTGC
jgi:formate C-acetyltransferase